jgi:cold shock CspA family protein
MVVFLVVSLFSEMLLGNGDAVSFETEDSPKGMNAINVQKA